MLPLLTLATLLAALGSALVGGVFFAFSSFVMRALERQPAPAAIRAMQAINVTVLNPLFLGAFFGTALLCLALLAAIVAGAPPAGAPWLAAGAALYLVGGIGVTVVRNVPLNNALAKADPESIAGAALWQDYRARWTRWNHLRTIACLGAAADFMLAL